MNVSKVFDRLHGADFYRAFHRRAAGMLAEGAGKTWLDVGCGPGVLACEAASRGYRVRGVDRQPAMIAAATRRSPELEFAVSDLEAEADRGRRYDVVSASSLLTVLPDPRAGFARLAALTKPGGSVLVIEATRTLRPARALALIARGRLGARAGMLLLWSVARSGRAPPVFEPTAGCRLTARISLLDGLVEASIFQREGD